MAFAKDLTVKESRRRYRLHQSTSGAFALLGVMLAGTWVYQTSYLQNDPVAGIAVVAASGFATRQLARVMTYTGFSAFWKAGGAVLGAVMASGISSLYGYGLVLSLTIGVAIGATLSARGVMRLLRWVLGLARIIAHRYGRDSIKSLRWPRAWIANEVFLEATASGEPARIKEAGIALALGLWNSDRHQEMPDRIEPIIDFLEQTQGALGQAGLCVKTAPGYSYTGQQVRGTRVLRRAFFSVRRELGQRRRLLADYARSAPLGTPIPQMDGRIVALRADAASLANALMALNQEMGDLQRAVTWGRRSMAHVRFLRNAEQEMALPATRFGDESSWALPALNLADLLLDLDEDPHTALALVENLKKYFETGRYRQNQDLFQLPLVLAKYRLRVGEGCTPELKAGLEYGAKLYREELNLPLSTEFIFVLAIIRFRERDLVGCKVLLERVNEFDDEYLRDALPVSSDDTKLALIARVRRHVDAYLSLLLLQSSDSKEALLAAYELCMRRKGLATQVQLMRRDILLSNRYPEFRAIFGRHTKVCRAIALAAATSSDSHLDKLREERRALETQLTMAIPGIRYEEKLFSDILAQVSSKIETGTVLVEFLRIRPFDYSAIHPFSQWRPDVYVAFVLTATKEVHFRLIGSAGDIDDLIAQHNDVVTGRRSSGRSLVSEIEDDEGRVVDNSKHGSTLTRILIEPLLPITGSASRLVIAPDSVLALLSFASLPLSSGGFLADEYEVLYTSTGRDLLESRAERGRSEAVSMVVACPDYDAISSDVGTNPFPRNEFCNGVDKDLQSTRFLPLPGSRLEGDFVANALSADAWFGARATEGRLKRDCRSPSVLHIATHGFYFNHRPARASSSGLDLLRAHKDPMLRSGLAFAGANTFLREHRPVSEEMEDGLLTAEDVAGMDLLDTELVFLSACETGLGQVQVGEGVFGLRRAFILAGARTLIMTLWKVSDLATTILVDCFYQHLLDGVSKADALRIAQHTLRTASLGELRGRWLTEAMRERLAIDNTTQRRRLDKLAAMPDGTQPFVHPYYWAGFIIQGDPGLLRRGPRIRTL